MRDGTGEVRSRFRTREVGDLPTGQCGQCGRETYQTLTGSWQHWHSLVEACESVKPLERSPKPRTATKTAWEGLDTPVRAWKRSQVSTSTYRRPSWEWMGCR